MYKNTQLTIQPLKLNPKLFNFRFFESLKKGLIKKLLYIQKFNPYIVRLRAPCGARCMGHAIRTWPAVCSMALHSQYGDGAKPHLCMDEWNLPTPVRRRLSLTQAVRSKLIPIGLVLVLGMKTRSLSVFSQYFTFLV